MSNLCPFSKGAILSPFLPSLSANRAEFLHSIEFYVHGLGVL
jgi:hypothetical protein